MDLQSAETLTEFLQGKAGVTGGTGEIVGILKMMKETAEGELGEAGAEEKKAAKVGGIIWGDKNCMAVAGGGGRVVHSVGG